MWLIVLPDHVGSPRGRHLTLKVYIHSRQSRSVAICSCRIWMLPPRPVACRQTRPVACGLFRQKPSL